MRKEAVEYSAQANTNAATIQKEIDSLRGQVNDFYGIAGALGSSPDYRGFWSHVKGINELFKTLKPITPTNRTQLWEEFGSLCQEVKDHQRRAAEHRLHVSARKRDVVQSKLQEAHTQVSASDSSSDLAKAKALLNEALAWMRDGWTGFNATTQLTALNDGCMTKDDHSACWHKWESINECLASRRRELGEHYCSKFKRCAYDAIDLADTNPKLCKDSVKSIQHAMQGAVMSREQFDEVRRLLDEAWKRACHRQESRHGEWLERQRKNISYKRALIEGKEEYIGRLETQIDRCRDMEAGARSDDFASNVRGWIEEKYDKIADVRRQIEDLETQIREIEYKLNE
jgi:hypothetical protein